MIAFDIDGTLMGGSWQSPWPLEPRCAVLHGLLQNGTSVAFVSGRSPVDMSRTLRELRQWVHPGISESQVHLVSFRSSSQCAQAKSEVLAILGATHFIGDRGFDEKAASLAGIPFTYASSYFPESWCFQ